MTKIFDISLFSSDQHCCQVLTGLVMYARQNGLGYKIKDCRNDTSMPFHGAVIGMKYNGRFIVYDTEDGYLNVPGIRWLYEHCDLYFKRSYSEEYNHEFGLDTGKMFPLGLYRYTTYKRCPIQGGFLKWSLKLLLGRNLDYKVVGTGCIE